MLILENEFRDKCPGCAVKLSEFHSNGCDVQRCGMSGLQMHTCGIFDEKPNHECVFTVWDGYWPGIKECFEYGLFAYFVPNLGFVPCKADHLDAVADLNTLVRTATWSIAKHKWEM
jgi:hypothetical protein